MTVTAVQQTLTAGLRRAVLREPTVRRQIGIAADLGGRQLGERYIGSCRSLMARSAVFDRHPVGTCAPSPREAGLRALGRGAGGKPALPVLW
jgi:hypothetical protein